MRILILSLDYGLTTELIYLWRINDKLSNLLKFNNYKVKYLIHWFALTWSSFFTKLIKELEYWYWRQKNPFSGELFSLLRKLFWKMTKIIFFCSKWSISLEYHFIRGFYHVILQVMTESCLALIDVCLHLCHAIRKIFRLEKQTCTAHFCFIEHWTEKLTKSVMLQSVKSFLII